ncbi:hypothetical protein, partial [Lacticaseibacillus paracasei]|uniref:hypothetical protein n=1 Tax=Lacticaseibacillus paracasei TaxID=1597 RepID=UPI00194FBC94
GMPLEELALLLVPPITVEELKRDYALELEMGPAKANLTIVSTLFAGLKKGSMTAAIYLSKVRLGWRDSGIPSGTTKDPEPPSETDLRVTPAALPSGPALEAQILNLADRR